MERNNWIEYCMIPLLQMDNCRTFARVKCLLSWEKAEFTFYLICQLSVFKQNYFMMLSIFYLHPEMLFSKKSMLIWNTDFCSVLLFYLWNVWLVLYIDSLQGILTSVLKDILLSNTSNCHLSFWRCPSFHGT